MPQYREKNEVSKASFKSFALINSCRIFKSREKFQIKKSQLIIRPVIMARYTIAKLKTNFETKKPHLEHPVQ